MRSRGFTLIELMIVVAIIAIIAAIAIPNLLESRMQANETNAIAALRQYATAQTVYQKANYSALSSNLGTAKLFATSFRQLGGGMAHQNGNGDSLQLLPRDIGDAISGGLTYSGYFFTDDTNILTPQAAYDFGLFADPFAYSKTGINTFYVNSRGMVQMKDLAGAVSGGNQTIDTTWIVP